MVECFGIAYVGGHEREDGQPVSNLSDAFQRLAGIADIFAFCSSERQEFKAIIGSMAISDARGQAERTGRQRDLQVDRFADLQVAGSVHTYAAFSEVDAAAGYEGRGYEGRCLFEDPDSYVLFEAVTSVTTADDVIHRFELCVHRPALWDASL